MKCANCPVNDGYCVFVSETRVRCPIPLLRERRVKAKNAMAKTEEVRTEGEANK